MPATKFPTDRKLTGRMLTTVFLLGLLYAVFVAALLAAHVSVVLVVVVALAVLGVQYFFSDRIALYSMGGKIVTRQQEPRVYAVVDRLIALADMAMPAIAVAQSDIPNAFATGRDQKHSVVCVTTGLLRRLDDPELEAVLAHELSHVAHRDVAVMTIASFLGILAGFATRIFYYMGLFGDDRNGNDQAAIFELGMVLVSAVVYAISFVLIRTLSRYRELAADRSGAILIGQPAMLAQALRKVSGQMSLIPTRDLRAAEHFNAFYFAPAIAPGASLSSLFATHPSLERRLEALAKLDAEMHRRAV